MAVVALDNVDVEVAAGRFAAIMGPSGSGKSTLMHLLAGLDRPTEGTVAINDTDLGSLDDRALTLLRREKVGFIFQSFQLLNTLTVLENVELPLLLAGQSDTRDRAQHQLELVELGDLGSRMPHQLSGGQMQRVAIARAMVHGPRLLLADEPTGNLDTVTGNLILEGLRRIADERKTAILMATHSAESADFTDAIVKMRDGRIQEVVRS